MLNHFNDSHATPLAVAVRQNRLRARAADELFDMIVDALHSLFIVGSLESQADSLMSSLEQLFDAHHRDPHSSGLRQLIPSIGHFFTPLPFGHAFQVYNRKYCLTKRRFVPPSFDEVRHVMNIAQIMAVKNSLKLISFDGDKTLYADGYNFDDEALAGYLSTLMQHGVTVAIVTAAAYAYQTEKYETRLSGLLDYFRASQLTEETVGRFYLFGGEANYLLRCGPDYHLHPVPESQWSHLAPFHRAEPGSVAKLLDAAEAAMELAIADMHLRVRLIRKERAVGMVPGGVTARRLKPHGSGGGQLKREILEEVVYRVKQALRDSTVPYCAFNGGGDMWVDIGNKAEGLRILQACLGAGPAECLHVGDQFSYSGNDIAARHACPTVWIDNPSETKAVLRSLLRQLDHKAVLQHQPPCWLSLYLADAEVAGLAPEDDEDESALWVVGDELSDPARDPLASFSD